MPVLTGSRNRGGNSYMWVTTRKHSPHLEKTSFCRRQITAKPYCNGDKRDLTDPILPWILSRLEPIADKNSAMMPRTDSVPDGKLELPWRIENTDCWHRFLNIEIHVWTTVIRNWMMAVEEGELWLPVMNAGGRDNGLWISKVKVGSSICIFHISHFA